MQAGNRFRGTFNAPGTGKGKKAASRFCTVKVDFEASQASLHALVKSMYTKKIELTNLDALEVLALADFLQVRACDMTLNG